MTTTVAADHVRLDRLVRRVTAHILPLLLLMYILAFLDRSNLGFAKASYQADTHISDAAYAFGAGIFFVGYAILEIPSNLILRKVGARIWMARIMVTWGIVSALMVFAKAEWSFYLLRVLLGITEAGFFPGVILFLTYWIPRQYRARVNGFFYFGLPLAFIFGGPLSGLLLQGDGLGGLRGWQLMFLVTGLLTVVVGILAFVFLDNGPQNAKWLNEDDRALLMSELAKDTADQEEHSPGGALRALGSPRVIYFAVAYFTIQASVYGVTFALPTQIATIIGAPVGLGVGLLTAVPWGLALIVTFALSRIADRTGKRRIFAGSALFAAAVGIALSGVFASPILALAALSLAAAGLVSVQPLFWTLPTSFLVGAAAASGIALINAVGNLGGFVAPIARTAAESAIGPSAGTFVLAIVALLGSILIFASRRVSTAISTDEHLLAVSQRASS